MELKLALELVGVGRLMDAVLMTGRLMKVGEWKLFVEWKKSVGLMTAVERKEAVKK